MANGPDQPTRHLDVRAVHDQYSDFVWLVLQRFGIRASDLEDVFQEVFVVVHQRLHTYDPNASLKAWLYGISLRVAVAHRRQAYVRREQPVNFDGHPHEPLSLATPEQNVAIEQRREQIRAVLDEMDIEKRALFVMYEIDEQPCEEIASTLGVPIGTVYSRLSAMRKEFDRAVIRWKARVGERGSQ